MKAVFDPEYIRRINGPNVKTQGSKMDKAQALMEDIEQFRKSSDASRLVMIWCGSTEVFHRAAAVHQTIESFDEIYEATVVPLHDALAAVADWVDRWIISGLCVRGVTGIADFAGRALRLAQTGSRDGVG